MITFTLYDADGVPLSGASPSLLAYVDGAGQAHEPPSIEDIGGGMYAFTPEPERAYLIDGGEDASPRYLAGSTGALVAVAFYGAEGAPWEGEPPTFDHYDGEPPELVQLATGLWGWVPTIGDRRARASYRIAAPEGAEPAYYTGSVPGVPPVGVAGPRLRIGGRELPATIQMKRGDLLPSLEFEVVDGEGQPMDLSGYDVRVSIAQRPGGEPIVDEWADVYEPAAGRGRHDWRPGETGRTGLFRIDFQVWERATGRPFTLPRPGYGLLSISERVRP